MDFQKERRTPKPTRKVSSWGRSLMSLHFKCSVLLGFYTHRIDGSILFPLRTGPAIRHCKQVHMVDHSRLKTEPRILKCLESLSLSLQSSLHTLNLCTLAHAHTHTHTPGSELRWEGVDLLRTNCRRSRLEVKTAKRLRRQKHTHKNKMPVMIMINVDCACG